MNALSFGEVGSILQNEIPTLEEQPTKVLEKIVHSDENITMLHRYHLENQIHLSLTIAYFKLHTKNQERNRV